MMGHDDKRGHVRHTVHEPCRAIVEGREYPGAVVNMSLSGGRIELDVELEAQPAAGKPVMLYVERIGQIPTKVVRTLIDGIAVEFTIDKDKDRRLVAAIMQVLNEYAR